MSKKRKILLAVCIIIFIISFFSYFLSIRLVYPKKYTEIIEKYSEIHSIDSELIYAMIKAESNFKSDASSVAGAIRIDAVITVNRS